jgi:hypothetical protein
MSRLRVLAFGISLDGFSAGPTRAWKIRSASWGRS